MGATKDGGVADADSSGELAGVAVGLAAGVVDAESGVEASG